MNKDLADHDFQIEAVLLRIMTQGLMEVDQVLSARRGRFALEQQHMGVLERSSGIAEGAEQHSVPPGEVTLATLLADKVIHQHRC